MGAVIIALRGSDHKRLEQIAAERRMSVKDMAGVLLEQAIRRELPAPADDTQQPGNDNAA